MSSRITYCCSLLVMLWGATAFILASCTTTVTTEDGSVVQKKVFLEDMGNGMCRQLPAGLIWQVKESRKIATLDEANEYVNSLQLGGFDDWRLPTRAECLTFSELLEFKKGNCPIKFKRAHWVSNHKKNQPGYWEDYPLCGGSEFRWIKGTQGSVRAVRP